MIEFRHQDQIHQPTDQKQAEGEEVDGAADRSPVVKMVGTQEPEDPEDVAEYRGPRTLASEVK